MLPAKLLVLFLLSAASLFGQKKCFEQHAYYLGTGLQATLSQVTVRIPGINQNSYSGAALSRTLSADAEYAILRWLSIGMGYTATRYLTEGSEQLYAHSVFPVAGVHPFARRKFDLAINLSLGFSAVTYLKNDSYLNSARGTGRTAGISLSPRLFVSQRFISVLTWAFSTIAILRWTSSTK